ncbi:RNA polymerase II mediator complex component [Verticillium dahliae]
MDDEISRQRACRACTDAKRRCDKALPSCLRCLNRDVDCVYPPPKRRRYQLPSESEGHGLPSGGTPASRGHRSDDRPRPPSVDAEDDEPGSRTGDTASEDQFPDTPLEARYFDELLSYSAPRPKTSIVSDLMLSYRTMTWFLPPSAWVLDQQLTLPPTLYQTSVLNDFVHGLQMWLVRYLRQGHSPLIHRRLYTETHMPQDMRDAIAAIALSQTATPDNEYIISPISSAYLSALLIRYANDRHVVVPNLSTAAHLARTQALLIHVLLGLLSPSIRRRAEAESHLDTLLRWTRQLWDSANLDAATSSLVPLGTPAANPITGLYRAFILTESVRRTYLIAHITAGVYLNLRSSGPPYSHACRGDVYITQRAGLWDAAGAASWEATVLGACPLFLHCLRGHDLPEVGIAAGDVDEFARHLFTVLWEADEVERWTMRTGGEVTAAY